jgi:hypothetical protein
LAGNFRVLSQNFLLAGFFKSKGKNPRQNQPSNGKQVGGTELKGHGATPDGIDAL